MKEILKISFPLILVTALAAGCQDDDENTCCDPTNPECPNYDPCLSKSPVTAEFKILDDIYPFGPLAGTYYEDNVLYMGNVKFEAVEESAYYMWYLGQEIVEGEKQNEVIKGINDLEPGTYTAALVVEKEPDTICFPMDTGRDSTFQTFEIKNICDLMIMNKFRGVFESNPSDSVEIELFPAKLGPGNQGLFYDCEDSWLVVAVNFGLTSDTLATSLTGKGILNKYYATGNASSNQVNGFLEVKNDSTCRAEYSLDGIDRIFNGRIIP